jgi:hypothetical protein
MVSTIPDCRSTDPDRLGDWRIGKIPHAALDSVY